MQALLGTPVLHRLHFTIKYYYTAVYIGMTTYFLYRARLTIFTFTSPTRLYTALSHCTIQRVSTYKQFTFTRYTRCLTIDYVQ